MSTPASSPDKGPQPEPQNSSDRIATFPGQMAPRTAPDVVPDAELEPSMERARQHLLSLQHPDGFWVSELLVDSTLCSDYIAYLHWHGRVDQELQQRCARHILRRQLPDGGWNIFEGGRSNVNASIKAYFALRLAGYHPEDPRLRRARATILRLGGIPQTNTYTRLYLALLGQFPWKFLPSIPAEIVLFPRWFPFNLYQMSSWSRAILIPLSIINHLRPTRHLPADLNLHELYPHGAEQEHLSLTPDRDLLSQRNFFLIVDRVLKWFGNRGWTPFRKLALQKAERWMLDRMGEGSDGLGAVYPSMLNALIALEALGYSRQDPVYKKALRDFEGLFVDDKEDFRIQPCLSPVWDTACTMIALAESGLEESHPALRRAARWLATKEVRIRGDWRYKNPYPHAGGWAFEFNNVHYPDVDDTAMVLLGLRLVKPECPAELKGLFERSLPWLMSFQCRDGGWAAFDKDVTQRWLEDVPFADHNAILDPSCSDLTGRILELLGYLGWNPDDRRIQRALAFLCKTQEPDGTWIGRWGINYIYGTWQALRGLRAIGQDMTQPWIVRSMDWIEACQNEDGGWGETADSYADPTLKGQGPSTPSQTAWALMALLAAGDPESESVRRGVRFLLGRQNRDGSWPEPETTGTGFPKVFYLKYDAYRNVWPLLALATYKNYRNGYGHATSHHRV